MSIEVGTAFGRRLRGRFPRPAGVFVSLITSALCVAPATAGPTPNVVLILADDAAYNEFGYTGATPFQTPNIDALAAGGIRFTSGYVTGAVCSPSRAGLLTGIYQQRFGYEQNISSALNGSDGLTASQVTLLHRFRDLGYTTGVIGKWHLGAVFGVNRPLDMGADEFFGFLGGNRTYWGGVANPVLAMRRGDVIVEDLWVNEGDPSEYDPVLGRYSTDAFGDEAVSFIDAHHADVNPFFLFLSFSAVHLPMEAKEQDLVQFPGLSGNTRIRAAMTLAMDRAVGKVVDALSTLGIADNTIVVFTNDNGGPLQTDNSPLRGFKTTTWEGGIRVPFVMRDPGLPGGIAYDRPVSVLDLTPTLLAAAGGGILITDGVDLTPFLAGQLQGDPHETLFWRRFVKWAVRDGDWKLVKSNAAGPTELFDLGSDIGEQFNIASLNPAIVDDLLRKLTLWETGIEKPRWGVAGADDQNSFDRFRFREQGGLTMWSSTDAWFRQDTGILVTMLPQDAYANAILEFPVAGNSYEAQNNMTRMTAQTFMLNEIRCTGQFAGALDAGALVSGNPVLFTRDLLDSGPRIRLDATSTGSGTFTFELHTDLQLIDTLEITGDGTQPLVLSGTIQEFVPGQGLIKTGTSHATLAGQCVLSGDLHVNGGQLTFTTGAGDLNTVTVGPLVATLEVADGAIVVADTVDVLPAGVLAGGGTVQGTTDNSGTIRPGSPVGTLTVQGTLATTGELEIEIANAGPGGFDALVVTGSAALGGTLTVTLVDAYVPRIGDTFEILAAASISGTFTDAVLPDLSAALLGWNLVQDANSVRLSVVKPGDVDGDGVVGIQDFLLLLAGWGPCPAPPDPCPADLDGDGSVGITDFLLLLGNWG